MATEQQLDLIDRKLLFNNLADYWGIPRDWDGRIDKTCEDALAAIEDAPTIEAEPVVHAYWIKEQDEHGIDRGWKCSNCRGSVYEMTYEPYEGCPHCRAKMDLEV